MKNVETILMDYLKVNEFDGLFNGDGDCACSVDDLAPCGDCFLKCEPGYKLPCPEDCGEHEFHIGPKPQPAASEPASGE